MSIASLLWRLVVLAFSFFVVAIVVTMVALYAARNMTVDVFAALEALPPEDGARAGARLAVGALAGLAAAAHVFGPWLIAIVATELLRWRHVLAHLGVGVVVALIAAVLSGAVVFVPVLQVLAALGLVGGFTHWLIAGRNAGRWLEDAPLPPRRP